MSIAGFIVTAHLRRHIIKMDDDTVYNVYELLRLMQNITQTRYLGGNYWSTMRPVRGKSKWRVSVDEWAQDLYPPYVSGMIPHYHG